MAKASKKEERKRAIPSADPSEKRTFFDRFLPQFLIAPSTLTIFGVLLFPILFALWMSLNRITFQGADTIYNFIGLQNYTALFTSDPWFTQSILTTLLFVVLTVTAEIMIGVGVALVLNKQFIGRGFVRGLIILPWAMPTIVNAVMWKWIFNAQYGAANGLLMNLGLITENINWLATPRMAFISILIANIWKETPYVVLLTIAALSTIPDDIYEAASIDGAGGWKAFWSITLPMIRPVILILAITKTIWAFQTFDLVAIMTSGGPENATNLLSYYIHRVAFKMNRFGSAAAMSYSLSIVCFALTFLYIRIFMDDGEGESKKKRRFLNLKREQLMAGGELE
ncbi:MAG: sugar ABC transporter permease [Actinomycetia bacterium]|nr:sugar ABC transporter permease [Actinomycetes bacterium]